jgi:type III pantothenate kinase
VFVMKSGRPAILVDIGNSRMKWGWCPNGIDEPIASVASVSGIDESAWAEQLAAWRIKQALDWVVASVQPERSGTLKRWVESRGDQFHRIERADQLPLRISLDKPDAVGIDRLLNALAAIREKPGSAAIIIDAGSAVTVDWIDDTGTFRGGAIFPGLQLMARSLHSHTALLPLVEVAEPEAVLPGVSTVKAMEAGILWAVAGGSATIACRMGSRDSVSISYLVTGGDAQLILPALREAAPEIKWEHRPVLTLEGLRLAAAARR